MQIDIRGVETELTDNIKKYATEKAEKFVKYGINIIGVELALEEDHNKTEDKAGFVKALIKIPGKDIAVKGEGKNLYAAIDKMEERASRELRELKNKNLPKSKLARSKEIVRQLFRRG